MSKKEEKASKKEETSGKPKSRIIFNADTLMFQQTIRTKEGKKIDNDCHIEACHATDPKSNYWVRLVKKLHGYETPKGKVKPMRYYWEIVRFAPSKHIIYQAETPLAVNIEATIARAKKTLEEVNEKLKAEGYDKEYRLEERDRSRSRKQKELGFDSLGFLQKYKTNK